MYDFNLLAPSKENLEDITDVTPGVDPTEESLDVILHEVSGVIQEMETDRDEFKAVLQSFGELNEVKESIEKYGIDDRLIAQVEDNLDKIAPSFKYKDVEATLAEIDASTEGIIEFIKEKASDLKARWKNGWTKAMKADSKIRMKLRQAVDKAKKAEGADISDRKIVAYQFDTADVTFPIIAKLLTAACAVPKRKDGKDLFETWTAEQTSLVDNMKLDNPKCLIKYYFDYHQYKIDKSLGPDPMTVADAGASDVATVLKYADMVMNSSFGDVKIENEFNKQYENIMAALRELPVGEMDTVDKLYYWTVDTLYTCFIVSEDVLRQFAVQSLLALQGVK